jgi:hypothetical protein
MVGTQFETNLYRDAEESIHVHHRHMELRTTPCQATRRPTKLAFGADPGRHCTAIARILPGPVHQFQCYNGYISRSKVPEVNHHPTVPHLPSSSSSISSIFSLSLKKNPRPHYLSIIHHEVLPVSSRSRPRHQRLRHTHPTRLQHRHHQAPRRA